MVKRPAASRRPVAPLARSAKKSGREQKTPEGDANRRQNLRITRPLRMDRPSSPQDRSPAFSAPSAVRQNGTDGVTPTRRVVLGGALAAAVWRLGAQARADGALLRRLRAFSGFEAAPARLQLAPPPAEPAAAYAYAGAIPGPLIRLRQGERAEAEVRQQAHRPTTLSFPAYGRRTPAAGIGGLTQERLQTRRERRHPLRRSRFRLQSLSAARGLDGRLPAGARPVRADHRRRSDPSGCRSGRGGDALRLERRRERADQGRFRRSRRRSRKRAHRRRRFGQWRGRATKAQRPARRSGAPQARQRRDRASGGGGDRRRKDPSSSPWTASRASRSNRSTTSSRWVPEPGLN